MRKLIALTLLTASSTWAWGLRGHTVANLAAVAALPAGDLDFLRARKPYIGHVGPLMDSWRSPNEAMLKNAEDPNHGWYMENFAGIQPPPTRREFNEMLMAKHIPLADAGDAAYAVIEGYQRLRAGMRAYRSVGAPGADKWFSNLGARLADISPIYYDPAYVRELLAQDVAFYMGWVGHYVADSAMPLHNSQHHNGWVGANPNSYTKDGGAHSRFEDVYVDLIKVSEPDIAVRVTAAPRHLDNPWAALSDFLTESRGHVEELYQLDKQKAFGDPANTAARELVYSRLAAASTFLRDLTYTAWLDSAL